MKRSRTRFLVCCSLVFSFLCPMLVQETQATLITYSFEGTIQFLNGPAFVSPNPFSTGQTIRGAFTYDTDALDVSLSDPTFGGYTEVVTNLSFSNGSYSGTGFQFASSTISIFDNISGNLDRFFLNAEVTGPPVNGSILRGFSMVLEDASGQALENTLLGTIPPLSAFTTTRGIDILFETQAGRPSASLVRVEVTALNPVPLPAAAALFPTGLGVLALAYRRVIKPKS